MNISRELSKIQASAVYHYKGPVLVLAGPGSGKTRVITYRVAYLIHNHGIPPESILAVTFTNKAAQEMINRLHDVNLLGETIGTDVWIHTFHATCVRILRKYGEKIGLNKRFAILDQDSQEELLAQFIHDSKSSISVDQVWLVRDFISNAKVSLKDPLETRESNKLNRINERNEMNVGAVDIILGDVLEVAGRYQEYISSHGVLDFDDLVSMTVKLLLEHADVRDELQNKFQFIMVDEYQDINLAQYELIRLLCNNENNLMVVADDDQSIYSWRGSDPSFIDKFKEQYKPKVIQLVDHYRSTQTILRASQSLIEKNTRIKKKLLTNNDRGDVIYYYKLDDINEELRLVRWLIRRLIKEKYYSPSQIAIFYRTHRLADKLEQYLIEHKVPVKRIRKEVFRNQSSIRSIISYLRMMCWELEPDLDKALNFPDVVMDEMTKLQVNNIVAENKVSLMKLFRNIGSYDVAPLTRRRIEQFVSLLDKNIELLKEGSAIKVVRGLLDALESERNPYHSDDLSAIENPPSFGDLQKAVNALYDKIQQKHPITIIAHYGIDNYCSAGIINYMLTSYFGMEVTCQFLSPDGDVILSAEKGEWERDISKNVLYLIIGEKGIIPPSIARQSILIGASGQWNNIADSPYIATVPSGEGGVVSTVALKLCQRLMSSYEAGTIEGLIAYDLETIGNQPKTAEIIEIAAKKMGARRKSENAIFHELVKPKKTIPKSSTDVHGITNDDVKDKPGIEEILPKFIDFIGNNILLGHNIIDFDNRVISRYMALYMGKPELSNKAYDTIVVAKRLFPLENYKLDALADKFKIPYESSKLHRANADVSLTENIFRSLRREELSRNERKSLKELLPLVALGILDKNAAMEKENSAFYTTAIRYVKYKKGRSEGIELLPISHLEASEEEEAIRFLENMANEEPPITKDDEVWNSIIARVQNSVINFERDAFDKSLTSFLSHAALLTGSDVSEDVEDKVTMMTVHSAKGTEFPVVIMIGMEQGNFPIISRDQSEAEMEEERRLCYVGMTRAKKRLYMTSVRFRNSDREATPSQFIWEIQPGLMKTVTAKEVRSAWDKRKNTAVSKQ